MKQICFISAQNNLPTLHWTRLRCLHQRLLRLLGVHLYNELLQLVMMTDDRDNRTVILSDTLVVHLVY